MKTICKSVGVVALVLLLLVLAPQNSLAQTVSVSPTSLSFGIPTITPTPGSAPTSAAQSVTVSITSGSVTFSSATLGLGASSPFAVVDGCTGTLSAPAQCLLSVTLTTLSTSLQTDTLTIPYSGGGSLTVSLSGAYGAIKLFAATNVNGTTGLSSPYTIAANTLNLSCPSGSTATLAGTPGTFTNAIVGSTLGYVLTDTYITLATAPTTIPPTTPVPVADGPGLNPAGNICTGGPILPIGGKDYGNCNSEDYEGGILYSAILPGTNPDSFVNPGNALLPPKLGNNPGGVPPIPLTSYFSSYIGSPSPFQATFTLQEYGSEAYDNSTLFLVTGCSQGGVISGSSVTLNAVSSTEEAQTACLDSSTNQNICFGFNDSVSKIIPAGDVPIVTDFAIPQQLFYQLVAGTSAAPAVCFRLAGELDYTVSPPAPMCKGFLLQCFNPNTGVTSGNNCTPTLSQFRDLLFPMQFASPDGPENGFNYLYDPVTGNGADACTYYLNSLAGSPVANGACAPGTGPGTLMGGDNWLCSVSGATCPAVATTQTPFTPPAPNAADTYSINNCALSGVLAGNLCPLDVMTAIQGAADGKSGNPTQGGNSLFIPVANMPMPAATASLGQNGWINNLADAQATFTSSPASYTPPAPASNYPPANTFTPAAPYSLTYGVSGWPLPDTTYPVPGDNAIYNEHTVVTPSGPATTYCSDGSGTAPNPFIPTTMSINGNTPTAYSTLTTPSSYFSGLGLTEGGIYYLHYFTTDCAYTEGLVFQPTAAQLTGPTAATANWASFPYTAFGVDTTAPVISSGTCSTSYPLGTMTYGLWYSQNVTETCNATDTSPGSGFAPGTAISAQNYSVLQGSFSTSVIGSTTVSSGSTNPAALLVCALCTNPATPSAYLQVSDLAGNTSTPVGPFTFQIDMTPPTISASAGNSTVGGSVINVTYTCSDVVNGVTGSGIPLSTGVPPSTGCVITNTPPNFTSTGCSPSSGATVTCGGTIATDVAESGRMYVNAIDNVGNQATQSSVNYTVSQATPTVTVSASNCIYSGGPCAAVTGASAGADPAAITYSYVGTGSTTYAASSTPPTNVGTYLVTASVAASSNYLGGSSSPAGFSITAAAQAITFTTLPPASAANGANFNVVATGGGSGNAVTFTASGGCTVAGTGTGTATYTMNSSGTTACSVIANQAGNANYSMATTVTKTVTVAVAPWTITKGSPCSSFSLAKPGAHPTCTYIVTNNTATAEPVIVNIINQTNYTHDLAVAPTSTNGCLVTGKTGTMVAKGGGYCSVVVTYNSDSDDTKGIDGTLEAVNPKTNPNTVYVSLTLSAID